MTATAGTSGRMAARGAGGLLVDPAFGGLFWGRFFSSAGVWMHSVVAAIVVYDATGSALLVGMVSVVQFAPQIFLSPWSGARADAGHEAQQILLGRLLCAAGSGSLACWFFVFPDADADAVTWAVLATSLVVGLGFVVGGPAMQSIIPSLIRPGELGAAMALNSVPMTTARIAGPAVGAWVAAHASVASSFALAAGTHLLFAAILVVVRLPTPPPRSAEVDYSVVFALRHVVRDRPLLLLLVAVTAIGFGSEPTTTLAPGLANQLGGGTALVGGLTATFGIGSAVGLFVMWLLRSRVSSARLVGGGLAFMVGGLMIAPVGTVGCAAVGFGSIGIAFAVTLTAATTLVQERVPPELRGRVMALWLVGLVGSRPIAAAMVGAVADLVATTAAFLLTAVIIGAVLAWCRPGRLGGREAVDRVGFV